MKTVFSKEYEKFTESRLGYHLMISKIINIGSTFIIAAFLLARIAIGLVSIYELIIGPFLLLWNLCFMVLRVKQKMKDSLIMLYLTITFILLCTTALEIAIIAQISSFLSIFFGLESNFFFSLTFLLKLPVKKMLYMMLIIYIHILVKIYTHEGQKPVATPIVIGMQFLILALILIKKEQWDFSAWNTQQRSNRQLSHFKQIMELFPSKIIILNKKAWEVGTPLYINQEANRIYERKATEQGPLSIKEFLCNFIFDSLLTCNFHRRESNELRLENEKRHHIINLADKISEIFQRENDITSTLDEFQSYLMTMELESSPKSGLELKVNKKYELAIGRIEWHEDDALILILNDISKSEKIRELKILHENKDRLLATVSHELRTPLNGIIGMVDVAYEKISDRKIRKFLKIALNSARILLFMINDLLDISQIQQGTLNLNIVFCNLNDLIEQVLPLIEVQLKKKGVALTYYNNCSKSILIKADVMRFQQIIMNLLNNACKFTKEGQVTISVEYSEDQSPLEVERMISTNQNKNSESSELLSIPEENIWMGQGMEMHSGLIVKVEDTGIGIKESKLHKLFQLFSKLKKKGNSTGVGLGLAISQSLAMKMGTKINVESEFGKGSTFWLKMKAQKNDSLDKDAELDQSSGISEERRLGRSDRSINDMKRKSFESIIEKKRRFRVLIVEDDQVNHIVLSEYMKELREWESEKAYNGKEALEKIIAHAERGSFFDLVLMDCNMPVMDGFQATEELRKMVREGEIPNLKIYALTANASINDREECLRRGMDQVWTKPVMRKEFVDKMRNGVLN